MTKTRTKGNIAGKFSIRLINRFNIALVFFIFRNPFSQKWYDHISSASYESVLEKNKFENVAKILLLKILYWSN